MKKGMKSMRSRCAGDDGKPSGTGRRPPPRRSWRLGQWLQGLRPREPLRLLANVLFLFLLVRLWPAGGRNPLSGGSPSYTVEVRYWLCFFTRWPAG